MASNSNYPQPSTAATNSGLKPRGVLTELAAFDHRPHDSLPQEAFTDNGEKYHKALDEIRDAFNLAKDNVALAEILQLSPEFAEAVRGDPNLRMVCSFRQMAAVRNIWAAFKKDQVTKRGSNAMSTFYGI